MKKKLYAAAISTAVAASFLTAGSAMATDKITPTITAAQIALASTCGKTGNFTFTFDAGTVINAGDKFEMALPLSASQAVTLCKGLDTFINSDGTIEIDSTTGNISATNWLAALAATPALGPVYGDGVVTGDIAFRITGSEDGQVVTLEAVGTGNIAVDDIVGDETVSIDFLNELNYATLTNSLWVVGAVDEDSINYTAQASNSTSAMCIDVSQWNESVVTISLDASDTKYSYSDTGPRIASIGGDNSYALRQCGPKDPKASVGTINIPEETQGGGDICGLFSNETGLDPYCDTPVHENNQFIIEAANGWAADNYTIEMTILVNGESGDHGVYFSDAAAAVDAMVYADACDLTQGGTTLNSTANTLYLASGEETAILSDKCDSLEDENKAVKLVIEDAVIAPAQAGDEGLYVPVPQLIFNGVTAGDVVTVEVKVNKAPCTDVITETWGIGSFVDSCSVVAGEETITYPYFVVPGEGGWWNGLAVTNYSMEAGMLKLMIYEEDGDQGTAEVEIGANSMFVDTLYSMITTKELFTQTAGEGTLGDSRSYVTVKASGLDIDGFGMISNSPTGQSMGYLTKDPMHVEVIKVAHPVIP